MTLILNAGGISALAGKRALLASWFKRDVRAYVPAIVLAEALTGDHRRDHDTNWLLKLCEVREVDEVLARDGARLRTCTRRAGTISATDAIVAAFADRHHDPIVLTSDPKDLMALAEHAKRPMRIHTV